MRTKQKQIPHTVQNPDGFPSFLWAGGMTTGNPWVAAAAWPLRRSPCRFLAGGVIAPDFHTSTIRNGIKAFGLWMDASDEKRYVKIRTFSAQTTEKARPPLKFHP
jgi:hypothetical protein